MNNACTFKAISDQFKSKNEYQKFMSECLQNYELKVYRVHTMTIDQAINYYKDLKDKYDSGIYQRNPTSWYQNQRRLFVWFLVCYIKFSEINALDHQHQWERLSDLFFEKDIRLLKYQYMNILKKGGRVNWNEEQDDLLIQAYNKFQKGEWNEIAKQIFFSEKSIQFKSPKNCRERWNNHLNTQIKKDPWSEDQDIQMLKLVREKGKKWSQIAKNLDQKRTEHQIKNRFNSLLNHAQKKQNQNQTLDNLISKAAKNKQASKFSFLSQMRVVKQEQKICPPIILIKSFQSNDEKPLRITQGGTTLVYCGKTNTGFDQAMTSQIQLKLFGSNNLSDIKSQHCWLDKSMLHTPGHHFLEGSSDFEKKIGDSFMLSQRGSMEKSHSEFTASMEFLKLPKSDISQEYKLLSSPSNEIRASINYDFSCEMKEM